MFCFFHTASRCKSMEEKLEDPQWLSELNERLDALAVAYEENHSITTQLLLPLKQQQTTTNNNP